MEDDRLNDFVALRPFEHEVPEVDEEDHRARSRVPVFRPTLPGSDARRPVQRLDHFASVDDGVGGHDLLANAWRRQEIQAASSSGGPQRGPPAMFAGMSLRKFGLTSSGGVLGDAVPGAGGPAAPRRQKAPKDGRSMDLMDLAFAPKRKLVDGEERSNYTPISLPYYSFVEEDELEAPTKVAGKREKMVHVDEANANMAKAMPEEGELFLMQMPSVLPKLMDLSQAMKREEDDAASAGAGSSITKVPDGRLGKLRVYKSGKVRMEIGGLEFCVDQGCETFFHQEISCVCPLAKEIINLGPISKRMVLTPDLESMLVQDTVEPKAEPDVVMAPTDAEPAAKEEAATSGAGTTPDAADAMQS